MFRFILGDEGAVKRSLFEQLLGLGYLHLNGSTLVHLHLRQGWDGPNKGCKNTAGQTQAQGQSLVVWLKALHSPV